MRLKTRKIITLLFFAVFAVTAPAVILYTGGYRYNWKKNHFEKTGLIQLDSDPQEATIILNGVKQKRRTPATLAKLLPDEYAVRLEKSGFLPWQKTLTVRSGETTFAKDVTLFKDALPRQLIHAEAVTAAFARDGAAALLRKAGDGMTELIVTDPGSRFPSGLRALKAANGGTSSAQPPTLLARFGAGEHSSEKLSWSPSGSRLALWARRADGGKVLFIYPLESGKEPIAVHELLPGEIREWRWAVEGDAMTVVNASGVFRIDASDGTTNPIATLPNATDALTDGATYILRSVLRQVKNEESAPETLLEKAGPGGRAPLERLASLPRGRYRFIGIRGSMLLLADDLTGKALLMDASDGSIIRTFMASDAVWNDKGALLLWNDFEINVYGQEIDDRTVVTRLGTAISGCAWHPDGKHVIYATATDIMAIDLDVRDKKNVNELGRFTGIQAFVVDPAGAWLRTVGSVGSQTGVFERDL